MIYNIKIFTYDNGIYEETFNEIDYEHAVETANQIFFSYYNGWWWEFNQDISCHL